MPERGVIDYDSLWIVPDFGPELRMRVRKWDRVLTVPAGMSR